MLHETDLSRVDLNLLVLFEAIMAERHVGRAAERLSLSPSAVSHGLERLRRMLHDPLFIKHPKGMNPTARALALAQPIAEALAQVRAVVEAAHPFAPERSQRRFRLGMPDAVAAVVVSPLLRAIAGSGPGIDLSVVSWMPQDQWSALDRHEVDAVVGPADELPARFDRLPLYEERFVIVGAAGHPWLKDPTLEGYCSARHVLVSTTGDPFGLIDRHLAARGLTRRVALTAPSFVFALAAVASSDLLAALPGAMVARFAPTLGLGVAPPPIEVEVSEIAAIVPRPALRDAGVAWLMDVIGREVRPELQALSGAP